MRRTTIATFTVLLGYAAVSFAYFGWRLLPHPGRILVGTDGQHDPEIFVWSFAWWPHAILTWTNPFFSHVVYAPTGVNLAWATSVPGLAVAFAPLTLLFGPSVSYNVAAVLLPPLSAWTAYLLFRYLTHSSWASLVGGYLYGFSSYMLAHQLAGHLHLTAAFLVPLVALVVLRYLRGDLDARGLAWRLGAILAFQAYISTEVALTVILVLALGLAIAFALVRDARRRLVSSLPPIAAAGALAAVLAAPLLYYALTAIVPFSIGYPWLFSADPLNLIVPTSVIGLGGKTFASVSSHFPGNDNERDSYLGLPILVIAGLLLWRRPWTGGTRFLVAAFGAATFLSLGTALYLDGHRMFWWPWSAPSHWTGLKNIIPSRFALYATLAADTMVATWIARTKGAVFRRPYVLPLLAVFALLPPVWTNAYVEQPQRLAFFSDGLYKTCIPRGETLMIFPFAYWGDSLLWQAESGFWFKMAEGALGPSNLPESFAGDPTVNALLFQFIDPSTRPTMKQLLALVRRRHVDRVVSAASVGAIYPNSTQMHAFGVLQQDGDIFVAPACGYNSLAGDTRPPP
jgi:hypothetical protein